MRVHAAALDVPVRRRRHVGDCRVTERKSALPKRYATASDFPELTGRRHPGDRAADECRSAPNTNVQAATANVTPTIALVFIKSITLFGDPPWVTVYVARADCCYVRHRTAVERRASLIR